MAYPRTGAKMVKTVWIGDVQSGNYDNQVVELKGWVKRTRGSNKIRFIVLRDSTGTIQCVAKRDALGDEAFEAVKSALVHHLYRSDFSLVQRGDRWLRHHTHDVVRS